MKRISFVAMAVLVLLVGLAASVVADGCDIEKGPAGGICLYQRYVFPQGTLGEGIVSLNYLASGKIIKERGLQGLWKEVIEAVLSQYLEKDRETGFSSYIVAIAVYPYDGIEANVLEEEFDRLFLETIVLMKMKAK